MRSLVKRLSTMGFSDTVVLRGSITQTAGLPAISNRAPHGSITTFCVVIGAVPLTRAPSDMASGVWRRPTFTRTVSLSGLKAGAISRTSPTVFTAGSDTSAMARSLSVVALFIAHSWTLNTASRAPSRARVKIGWAWATTWPTSALCVVMMPSASARSSV